MKILLFLLFTYSSMLQSKSVTIGIHEYPPFYGKEKKGLLIDIYNSLFSKLDIDVEYSLIPIMRCPDLLMKNKIDFCSPGKIFLNNEQLEKVVNLQIINVLVSWVKTKQENKDFIYKNVDQMKAYKHAIIKNSPLKVIYDSKKFNYIEVESYQQLIDLLFSKRVDFFESTLLSAKTYAKNSNIELDYYIWNKVQAGLIALKKNKENSSNLTKLKNEFEKMKKNGELEKILKKYWLESIPKEIFIKY